MALMLMAFLFLGEEGRTRVPSLLTSLCLGRRVLRWRWFYILWWTIFSYPTSFGSLLQRVLHDRVRIVVTLLILRPWKHSIADTIAVVEVASGNKLFFLALGDALKPSALGSDVRVSVTVWFEAELAHVTGVHATSVKISVGHRAVFLLVVSFVFHPSSTVVNIARGVNNLAIVSSRLIMWLGGLIDGVVVMRCFFSFRILGVIVVAVFVVLLIPAVVLTAIPIVLLLILMIFARRDVFFNGQNGCFVSTRRLTTSAITAPNGVASVLVSLVFFCFKPIVVCV